MHFVRALTEVLWTLPALLEAAMVLIMAPKRLGRKYPFFMAYVSSDAFFSILLYVLDKLPGISGPVWWRIYVTGLAVAALLQFCVIYEMFGAIFKNRVLSERFGVAAFRWSFLVFFLMGLGLASLTQTHEKYYWFAVMSLLQQTAYFVQVGLLVSLFVFSAFLKLSWRNFAFGIALGMGIHAAANLPVAAIRAHFGLTGDPYVNASTLAAYAASVLVWMFYLWLPERVHNVSPKLPAHDLEVWNEELQRLVSR